MIILLYFIILFENNIMKYIRNLIFPLGKKHENYNKFEIIK
jgi:hypothetical protein